jgi:hypothetical protein
MLEFTGNHFGIRILEDACKELVKQGVAQCVKDNKGRDFQMEEYTYGDDRGRLSRVHQQETGKVDGRRQNFGLAVYKQYLIAIDSGKVFEPHIADIRFWYDQNTKIAGIKLSAKDLIAIMQTTAVINVLQKLDVSLGGGKDGEVNLDKVAQLLTQTITKISPETRVSFTAKKIEDRR